VTDPSKSDYARHLADELMAGRLGRREFIRKATLFGLSSSAAAALLVACGGGGNGSPSAATGARRGGTMRVATGTPTAALDPVTMYDSASIATVQQVAEYLIWVNNDLSLRPVLAESWASSNGGQTWTFTLRQGVNFQDGTPFTAKDVVTTFERLVSPNSGSAALSNLKGILSPGNVSSPSPGQVTFQLDRPFVDFPYMVSSTNYNAVILPASYLGAWEKKPVGTGPFTLSSYTTGQRATFSRNQSYWQTGLPYLEGVEIHYFATTQSQVLAMEGGAVDMMQLTFYEGAQPLFSKSGVRILSAKSSLYREFHMRVDAPPFTDKRVRQAVALTLNRDQIKTSLFGGRAQIGDDHAFAPVFPISPSLPLRKQDLQRARSLLHAAGHPNGVNVTLSLEDVGEIPQYAQLIQAMAKPAGIQIKLDVMPQATYYGSGSNQPWLEVPMGIVDWGARAVPSQVILPAYACGGIWNSSHWCDETFTNLARQLDATLDESLRRTIATQMATIQKDATPAVIAYWIEALRATSDRVGGVQADGTGFLDLTRATLS